MLPYDLLDALNEQTPCDGPSLHGPENVRQDIAPDKRPILIYPRFDWVLVDGAWERDWSAYVPYWYPKRVGGSNGC